MAEFRRDRSAEPIPVTDATDYPVHADRGILVTGAAGGVGEALVRLLVAQGARVVATDREVEGVRRLADELGGADAGVHAARLDLLDAESITEAVSASIDLLGVVDGLANVAGVVSMAPALEHGRALWDFQFGVNVFGTFEVARQVAEHLVDRGVGGAIVNVSSEAGKVGHADMVAYNASKAAVISMTRVLAVEWAPYGINVNGVAPGGVATPMLQSVAENFSSMTDDAQEQIFAHMANEQLGRHISPVEVARAISFLLSNEVQAIRGFTINVDGGVSPY